MGIGDRPSFSVSNRRLGRKCRFHRTTLSRLSQFVFAIFIKRSSLATCYRSRSLSVGKDILIFGLNSQTGEPKTIVFSLDEMNWSTIDNFVEDPEILAVNAESMKPFCNYWFWLWIRTVRRNISLTLPQTLSQLHVSQHSKPDRFMSLQVGIVPWNIFVKK